MVTALLDNSLPCDAEKARRAGVDVDLDFGPKTWLLWLRLHASFLVGCQAKLVVLHCACREGQPNCKDHTALARSPHLPLLPA